MYSLRLREMEKKKALPRKAIELTPARGRTRKLKANLVHTETSADLWYFTHT